MAQARGEDLLNLSGSDDHEKIEALEKNHRKEVAKLNEEITCKTKEIQTQKKIVESLQSALQEASDKKIELDSQIQLLQSSVVKEKEKVKQQEEKYSSSLKAWSSTESSLQSTLNATRKSLEASEDNNKRLKDSLNALQSEVKILNQIIKNKDEEVKARSMVEGDLKEENKKLKAVETCLKDELTKLKQQLQKKDADLGAQKHTIEAFQGQISALQKDLTKHVQECQTKDQDILKYLSIKTQLEGENLHKGKQITELNKRVDELQAMLLKASGERALREQEKTSLMNELSSTRQAIDHSQGKLMADVAKLQEELRRVGKELEGKNADNTRLKAENGLLIPKVEELMKQVAKLKEEKAKPSLEQYPPVLVVGPQKLEESVGISIEFMSILNTVANSLKKLLKTSLSNLKQEIAFRKSDLRDTFKTQMEKQLSYVRLQATATAFDSVLGFVREVQKHIVKPFEECVKELTMMATPGQEFKLQTVKAELDEAMNEICIQFFEVEDIQPELETLRR